MERTVVDRAIGATRLSADAYGGLNLQPTDAAWLPLKGRIIISISEHLKRIAPKFPPLLAIADSLYVHSIKTIANNDRVPVIEVHDQGERADLQLTVPTQ